MLAKHGIDLDDGVATVRPPRRSSNAALLSDQERRGNLLTIRDRDRKKLAYSVVVRRRALSVADRQGTNSYMAVEVIRGQGYVRRTRSSTLTGRTRAAIGGAWA